MITGRVTSSRDAVIQLTLFDAAHSTFDIEAVIDTGFNGYLTLSSNLIASLQLPLLRYTRLSLADGTEVISGVYKIVLWWDDRELTVSVNEANSDALVGMSLMYGFELILPVLDGAKFTLERIANM